MLYPTVRPFPARQKVAYAFQRPWPMGLCLPESGIESATGAAISVALGRYP